MDNTVAIVILSTTSVFVVLLNSFCVYIILQSKKLARKPSSILILSLLTLHLIQGACVMPFYALKKSYDNKAFCDLFRLTYMITFYGACLNVLLISIDRLLATILMMSYKVKVTTKRAITVITLSWLYIISICMIPFSNNNSDCSYNPRKTWTLFMLFTNCAIPYMLVVLIYVIILFKVRHTEHLRNKMSTKTRHRNKERQSTLLNKRLTRFTLYIVITYGIAWAPSTTYYILEQTTALFTGNYYKSTLASYISFFTKYIKFLEGVTTPILYCYFHDGFRKEFRYLSATRHESSKTDINQSHRSIEVNES